MQKNNTNSKSLRIIYQGDKTFYQLLVIALIVFAAAAFMKPDKFLTPENILSMLAQFPQFGIMTFSVMLAMILGGIDLSVVAIANLSSIAAAFIMTGNGQGEQSGTMILAGILAAVAAGAAAGWLNGIVVSNFHVPAMLATIGTAQVFQGISVVVTKGKAISGLPLTYSQIGGYHIGGVLPVPFLIFIVCAVILGFALKKTTFGANAYMLGTNSKAARYSGIKVKAYTQKLFIAGGVLAAVGGLVMMSRTNSAKADYGDAYTLQCVMIAILGGVDAEGGSGSVRSVVVAIFIVQIISSAINMFPSLNTYTKTLIWGLTLIAVMIWRMFSGNTRKNR